MKCEGWAARRGRSSRTEEVIDAAIGDDGTWALEESDVEDDCPISEDVVEALGDSWEAEPVIGDSTCCAVELKHRALFERRNAGGRVEVGIFMSNKDFLMDLLSMAKFKTVSEWVLLAACIIL